MPHGLSLLTTMLSQRAHYSLACKLELTLTVLCGGMSMQSLLHLHCTLRDWKDGCLQTLSKIMLRFKYVSNKLSSFKLPEILIQVDRVKLK